MAAFEYSPLTGTRFGGTNRQLARVGCLFAGRRLLRPVVGVEASWELEKRRRRPKAPPRREGLRDGVVISRGCIGSIGLGDPTLGIDGEQCKLL